MLISPPHFPLHLPHLLSIPLSSRIKSTVFEPSDSMTAKSWERSKVTEGVLAPFVVTGSRNY
jgi:hypothetical protein